MYSVEKKQEAPRAVDTPLHAEQPGRFTILGNPLTLLSSKKLGMPGHILESSFLLTKRATWPSSTETTRWSLEHIGSNIRKTTCKLCYLHLALTQASSQHDIMPCHAERFVH